MHLTATQRRDTKQTVVTFHQDVSHCWILSPDKTEWRLIAATLCG